MTIDYDKCISCGRLFTKRAQPRYAFAKATLQLLGYTHTATACAAGFLGIQRDGAPNETGAQFWVWSWYYLTREERHQWDTYAGYLVSWDEPALPVVLTASQLQALQRWRELGCNEARIESIIADYTAWVTAFYAWRAQAPWSEN